MLSHERIVAEGHRRYRVYCRFTQSGKDGYRQTTTVTYGGTDGRFITGKLEVT